LPARNFPGKLAAGDCRQEISPGKKLPEIAGKNFPREKSCRRLPARIFPGKKAAGNCRQEFSQGKKLPEIAGGHH
jgi:hypothetical protein